MTLSNGTLWEKENHHRIFQFANLFFEIPVVNVDFFWLRCGIKKHRRHFDSKKKNLTTSANILKLPILYNIFPISLRYDKNCVLTNFKSNVAWLFFPSCEIGEKCPHICQFIFQLKCFFVNLKNWKILLYYQLSIE